MTYFERKINILIPDGQTSYTLSVIRCLSECKFVNIHVIYSSQDNIESKYSKYISSSAYFKGDEDELKLVNFFKHEIQKNKINVVIPLHYNTFRLFSKFSKDFKNINVEFLVTTLESLDEVNNKLKLTKLLNKHDISYPRTYNNIADFKKYMIFPLLYKPIVSLGGIGIKLVNNLDELFAHIKTCNTDGYILQEYINGYDIDCSVLCKKGKILAYTIQKEYMPSRKLFGPPEALEFVYEQRILELIKKLIKVVNWTGVMHVDLRYDELQGDFKVIEINPRFWGSVRASCKAGVNFPLLYCLSSLGSKFKTPEYRLVKYANYHGLKKIILAKLTFNKNKIEFPENSLINDDISDPKPMLFHLSQKLRFVINSN